MTTGVCFKMEKALPELQTALKRRIRTSKGDAKEHESTVPIDLCAILRTSSYLTRFWTLLEASRSQCKSHAQKGPSQSATTEKRYYIKLLLGAQDVDAQASSESTWAGQSPG